MTDEQKKSDEKSLVGQLKITSPLKDTTINIVTDGHSGRCYASIEGTINTGWADNVLVAFFNADTFNPLVHFPDKAVTASIDDDNTFSHKAVPFDYSSGKIVAVAWQLDTGTNNLVAVSEPRISVNEVHTQEVTAKSCPWFANAPDRYEGPSIIIDGSEANDPKEVGPDFRPVEFIPPPSSVAVSTIEIENTTPAATWHNHAGTDPGDFYNANGTGSAQAVKAPYLDDFGFPTPSSAPSANLGALVAVVIYEDSSGVESAGATLTVGTGTVSADISIDGGSKRATRVLVGFYDTYEWGNNVGEMTVEVTYS